MQFIYKLALLGLSALAATQAVAANETLVWSDASGLKSISGCELSEPPSQLKSPLSELTSRAIEVDQALMINGVKHEKTFWQASRDLNQLVFLKCPNKLTYLAFEVYSPNELRPIAQVGVHTNELAIFRSSTKSRPVTVSAAPLELPAGVQAFSGSTETIVCTSSGSLNVRDESLNKVLFTANRHETLKVFQSFDATQPKKTIGGTTYTFVKVQFPSRPLEQSVGWVPEEYVKLRSDCAGAQVSTPIATPTRVWTFPTIKRPTDNYKEGMRRFNASRGGGSRSHAACDLYRVKDEQAVAATNGTVIRDRYYFYEGTYAIDVKHTGGKVARYGEITGKQAPNVKLNSTVKTGQIVGYIGKVNSNCCKPMLHFELYKGTATGALSQPGNRYGRRSDLMDPSQLLTEWEKLTFGQSY